MREPRPRRFVVGASFVGLPPLEAIQRPACKIDDRPVTLRAECHPSLAASIRAASTPEVSRGPFVIARGSVTRRPAVNPGWCDRLLRAFREPVTRRKSNCSLDVEGCRPVALGVSLASCETPIWSRRNDGCCCTLFPIFSFITPFRVILAKGRIFCYTNRLFGIRDCCVLRFDKYKARAFCSQENRFF